MSTGSCHHCISGCHKKSPQGLSRDSVVKNLPANRHRGPTYGHGQRGAEGETYGESDMETYNIICKIDSHREFAV